MIIVWEHDISECSLRNIFAQVQSFEPLVLMVSLMTIPMNFKTCSSSKLWPLVWMVSLMTIPETLNITPWAKGYSLRGPHSGSLSFVLLLDWLSIICISVIGSLSFAFLRWALHHFHLCDWLSLSFAPQLDWLSIFYISVIGYLTLLIWLFNFWMTW